MTILTAEDIALLNEPQLAHVGVVDLDDADFQLAQGVEEPVGRPLDVDERQVVVDHDQLPVDVQCPLARHLLRRWPPDGERSIRRWNWSAWRASDLVREHEARLLTMVGPDRKCPERQ